MGFFSRLFRIGKAEAHSLVDKLENPIKLTEQGIRDLKVDLDKSIKSLAEVKAMAIRARNETNSYRSKVKEYESKAILLLKRAQRGEISAGEADRLASMSLQKKEESEQQLKTALATQQKFDTSAHKLEVNVRKLRSNISKYENELKTLRARAKVSEATKKVNKQLSGIDSSGTLSMLERMKEKVEKDEALSDAYADIALENRSIDDEIDSALGSSVGASDSLAALKAKMGLPK